MSIQSVGAVGVIALLGLIVGGCASEGTMGSSGAGSAGATSFHTDSLQACMARLSSSGSAGARQIAEESCKREEAIRAGIVGTATAKSNNRVSSGSEGDTLDACMARIPKDATAGQQMLAEESCKRDQANRR
ncbi:MAG TPA: hypothetical protein VKP13_07585 [Nitrospira sp.]|nr:hypothetical protein [Nitrospira sp.]